MGDETRLRLFPPLRACRAWRGQQAVGPITGRTAKRVLFGTINLRTGHRVVLRRQRMRQEDFRAFLRLLRARYGEREMWLLVDEAPGHTAEKSLEGATGLALELVWLPKQCSELTAMDHLWKELKRRLAANRQFRAIDEGAEYAEHWVLGLSPQEARRKAGILSKNYWRKDFSKNFCRPT
jgi:transposase